MHASRSFLDRLRLTINSLGLDTREAIQGDKYGRNVVCNVHLFVLPRAQPDASILLNTTATGIQIPYIGSLGTSKPQIDFLASTTHPVRKDNDDEDTTGDIGDHCAAKPPSYFLSWPSSLKLARKAAIYLGLFAGAGSMRSSLWRIR